ncbi:MAG: type VI secretion system-associated protein TagF [Rubrivivax sp.]|jgi:type VI secretion system protein ImpM|nr:type VI secretion system-associated protein TagF [Rubrivivax sp.]
MDDGSAPGWHGKLPSLGDFASRRLPHEFIEAWDGWLAGGLAALRETAADSWLDGYLASPIWRFLLLPGVLAGPCGQQGWTGVLMPSVDRAGRYFPFTVAWALPALPRDGETFTALHRWLRQLDDLAADALQDDWTVPQLEAELARLRLPALAAGAGGRGAARPAPPASVVSLPIASAADVTALITEDALAIWQTASVGHAYWWCEPGADPGRLVVTRGLPAGAGIGILFAALGAGAQEPSAGQDSSSEAGSG